MMRHRMGLDQGSVVEAAIKLVDEEGWEQLSLGRLATRLGVRTPSLYNHIAGMTDLKQRMTLYCLRDLLNILLRATVGKARAEAIYALADTYRAYAREAPARYTLTLQAPDDPEAQVLAGQIVDVIRAILAPYFRLTQTKQGTKARDTSSQAHENNHNEQGELIRERNEENAIHAIRGLRSIVQGFISLETVNGFALPLDMDASFHWLIDIFVAGLDQSVQAHREERSSTGEA